MRLIDADAFEEFIEKVYRPLCDDYHMKGYVLNQLLHDIQNEPTVDAIPIEWIEKWLDEFLGTKLEEEITDLDPFKKNVYQGIFLMYNDWRRGDGK